MIWNPSNHICTLMFCIVIVAMKTSYESVSVAFHFLKHGNQKELLIDSFWNDPANKYINYVPLYVAPETLFKANIPLSCQAVNLQKQSQVSPNVTFIKFVQKVMQTTPCKAIKMTRVDWIAGPSYDSFLVLLNNHFMLYWPWNCQQSVCKWQLVVNC